MEIKYPATKHKKIVTNSICNVTEEAEEVLVEEMVFPFESELRKFFKLEL